MGRVAFGGGTLGSHDIPTKVNYLTQELLFLFLVNGDHVVDPRQVPFS